MIRRFNHKSEAAALTVAIARCHNPLTDSYPNYGGRGVAVCPEWRGQGGFARFFAHIGPKPTAQHSLDRIDGTRGYEPDNVRWVTRTEQNRNRANCYIDPAILDFINAVACRTGLHRATLRGRFLRGWALEELDLPVMQVGRKPKRETAEKRGTAVRMLEEGSTRIEIARELGVTIQRVRQLLQEAAEGAWVA